MQGADVNLQGPCSFSALHIAAKRGQTSVIKFLLDRGFPVNLLDSTKQTCLHVAVTFSGTDTIKCILEVISLKRTTNITFRRIKLHQFLHRRCI